MMYKMYVCACGHFPATPSINSQRDPKLREFKKKLEQENRKEEIHK